MGNILDNITTVQSNVQNNRKNLIGQQETLKVQLDNVTKTVEEMDSLAAVLRVVLADEKILAAAEAKLLEPIEESTGPLNPAA